MKNSSKTQKQFEGILDRYFEGELADNPMMANELGLSDAHSREFNPDSEDLVIELMDEQREVTSKGGTGAVGQRSRS